MITISLFADDIRDAFDPFDLGPYVLLVAVALAGMLRSEDCELPRCETFNETIKLTQDDGGLRFATEEVEHYLKWRGISQLLLEPDGVVVSHGNLFFLIPNQAFANTGGRVAFIRDVYDRLGERARSMSYRYVSSLLKSSAEEKG
jgi:hypothetical protein